MALVKGINSGHLWEAWKSQWKHCRLVLGSVIFINFLSEPSDCTAHGHSSRLIMLTLTAMETSWLKFNSEHLMQSFTSFTSFTIYSSFGKSISHRMTEIREICWRFASTEKMNDPQIFVSQKLLLDNLYPHQYICFTPNIWPPKIYLTKQHWKIPRNKRKSRYFFWLGWS